MGMHYTFAEEQIRSIAHELAIQKCATIGGNFNRRKTKEYIETYLDIVSEFKKYNQTGELPNPN